MEKNKNKNKINNLKNKTNHIKFVIKYNNNKKIKK